jgi:hypothetical protein
MTDAVHATAGAPVGVDPPASRRPEYTAGCQQSAAGIRFGRRRSVVTSTLTCPHGGSVSLTTSNVALECGDGFALVESDVHFVVGCTFIPPGSKPSLCVKVTWSGGSASLDADGVAVLTRASVGHCESSVGDPGPP